MLSKEVTKSLPKKSQKVVTVTHICRICDQIRYLGCEWGSHRITALSTQKKFQIAKNRDFQMH
jgi:hypothetical protein